MKKCENVEMWKYMKFFYIVKKFKFQTTLSS